MGATERVPMGATERSQRTSMGSPRHRNPLVRDLQAFYIFAHMFCTYIQVVVMRFTTYCLGRDRATRPTWCEQGSPWYGSAVAKLGAQSLALLCSKWMRACFLRSFRVGRGHLDPLTPWTELVQIESHSKHVVCVLVPAIGEKQEHMNKQSPNIPASGRT
jgi:hypothetical protein